MLAGCASTAPHDAPVPGGVCHVQGQGPRLRSTCTLQAVPAPERAVEARGMQPDARWLTVVVLRDHWADTRERVNLGAAGVVLETVPRSFGVLRLPPGSHRLSATWSTGRTELPLQGAAGELLVVDVVGLAVAGHSSFRLETAEPLQARPRLAGVSYAGLVAP